MRHSDQKICSSLAGYVWKLKDEGREFDVRWKILQQHTTFNPTNNSCRLCLSEKFTIMFQPQSHWDEFYTPCMHKQNKAFSLFFILIAICLRVHLWNFDH